MAVIQAVYSRLVTGPLVGLTNPTLAKDVVLVTWSNITLTDTCQPVFHPEFEEKSVEVDIAGTSPSVSIQGGNDPSSAVPKTLNSKSNIPLTFTSNGIEQIAEKTAYVQPSPLSGVGTTATIRLLMSSLQRSAR